MSTWADWYLRLYRCAHRSRGVRRRRLRLVLLEVQRANYAASRYANGGLSLAEQDLPRDLPLLDVQS